MSLNIFPSVIISSTDESVINTALSNPSVKKYLTMLAQQSANDILTGEPAIGETAESYLRRQAAVKGRLEVLETLLSIQAVISSES